MAGTDFLFVGHTHLQFSLRQGEQSVVNPGSIGQPKTGTARAAYAIWENSSVRLHKYEYPVQKTAARVHSIPVSASTKEFLVKILQSGAVPKSKKEVKRV